MTYYVIIRGPLGCGKTTLAKALSKKLNARYFAIERVLDEHNLEEWENGYISVKSFIRANEIAAKEARKELNKGVLIVFDGNFYHKSQIDDLIERLDFPHYVFTLKAPLEVCIERDKNREKTHGKHAAEAVYKKSTSFGYGHAIDITKPLDEAIKEILKILE